MIFGYLEIRDACTPVGRLVVVSILLCSQNPICDPLAVEGAIDLGIDVEPCILREREIKKVFSVGLL